MSSFLQPSLHLRFLVLISLDRFLRPELIVPLVGLIPCSGYCVDGSSRASGRPLSPFFRNGWPQLPSLVLGLFSLRNRFGDYGTIAPHLTVSAFTSSIEPSSLIRLVFPVYRPMLFPDESSE